MRKAHSIPTLLALLILLVVIVGLSLSSSQITRLFSRASTETPVFSNVQISNINETGWSVSFTTDKAVGGVAAFGSSENLGDGIAADDREIVSPNGKYKTHFVTIRVNSPGKYFFCFGNDTSSLDINLCAKKNVIVPASLAGGQNIDPSYGRIVNSSGQGVGGAIVTLQVQGASMVGAISKTDGTFIIPMTSLRTADLSSYFVIEGEIPETVKITGPDLAVTNITCVTGLDRPFPNLVLGKDGDCRDTATQTSVEEPAQQNETVSQTPNSGVNKFKTIKTGITNIVPDQGETTLGGPINIQEGQVLDNSLPTFSGIVNPGDVIHVEVHSSTPISATIKASKDGSWTWTPPTNLEPGSHTVTLTITLASGAKQTVTRTFTVSPGVDILPITFGTPSASITLTPTPTPIPTVIFEDTPTPTFEDPQPSVTPPVTGSLNYSLGLIAGGVALLLGAVFLLL